MTEARSLEDCRLCKKQMKMSLDRTSKIREQKPVKKRANDAKRGKT